MLYSYSKGKRNNRNLQIFTQIFCNIKYYAYLCAMEKRKRGRPKGSKSPRKTHSSKVIFRERWNRAWARLCKPEQKAYTNIVSTMQLHTGAPLSLRKEIYAVGANRNNSNHSVLHALEQYVATKPYLD